MAANTAPIFTLTPNVGGIGNAAITAANTAVDGTGTVTTIFTAGAAGGYVQGVRWRAAGNCTATVGRIFLNNGNATTSATNNILIGEITLATTTITQVAALPDYFLPLNFAVNANYTLTTTLGTAVSAGYYVSVVGGSY